MSSAITSAGFVNLQERIYKVPFGAWARHPILMEAWRWNKAQLLAGMEWYAMYVGRCRGEERKGKEKGR